MQLPLFIGPVAWDLAERRAAATRHGRAACKFSGEGNYTTTTAEALLRVSTCWQESGNQETEVVTEIP